MGKRLTIGFGPDKRSWAHRAIVSFAGALLLALSQTVAIAHWHRLAQPREVASSATTKANLAEVCPLCLYAFHLPGNLSASSAVPIPEAEERGPVIPLLARRLGAPLLSPPPRGPPVR